jgi:hypothetical protein
MVARLGAGKQAWPRRLVMRFIKMFCLLGATILLGCQGSTDPNDNLGSEEYGDGKYDSSAAAVFLDFEFDGSLYTNRCFSPRSAIDQQMLYTVGQLNGHKSVGRLDQAEITQVETLRNDDGSCIIEYHARIPVAWGKLNDIPETFTFQFPRDVSSAGSQSFMDNYESSCLASGAHDVTAGIFWYYYRPDRSRCQVAEEDISPALAAVSESAIQTEGKYPEYHKVWEDNVFEVVAIFGKVEDGGGNYDAGVRGYGQFVKKVIQTLHDAELSWEPSMEPDEAGLEYPEVTIRATYADGRQVKVSAFLIDSVGSADSSFWGAYEALTPTADFIVYNGHSGLGANIRKLAQKGVWATGQYSIVFMNGCDTYAYVDSALAEAHAEVNDDDPEGTLYLDVMANAMPSFFRSMPEATMAMVKALLDRDNPKTYQDIFTDIDSAEIVLVTGEHDNVYEPGYNPGGSPE